MTFEPEINLVAPLVGGLAMFVLGGLWYGPLFGKMWMKGMGWTEAPKPPASKMAMAYLITLVTSIVTAFVFAHVMAAFGAGEVGTGAGPVTPAAVNRGLEAVTMGAALEGAGWTWLGFFLPVQIGRALWENKSWSFVALNSAYYLIGLAVMAIVIVAMA